MYGFVFNSIYKLGKDLINKKFSEELENESIYSITHQNVLKISSLKDKKGKKVVKKPIIEDDNFEIYNSIVEKIYSMYLDNNKITKNLFNNKTLFIDEFFISNKNIFFGDYIKDNYNEVLEEFNKQVYIKKPSIITDNLFNNPKKYMDIKLNIVGDGFNLIKKDKIEKGYCIDSVFYYVYFLDKKTKTIKNFFMDNKIIEIFENYGTNLILNPIKDELSNNLLYIELAGNRIPYIEGKDYSEVYKNYIFGKKIIETYFTLKLYGKKITIFPNNINFADVNMLSNLFNLFINEIKKLEKNNSNKKRNRDIGLLNLLYNIYEFTNNKDYKELSYIPYSFLVETFNISSKQYELYKSIDGITMGGLYNLLSDLSKRTKTNDFNILIEIIEKLTSNSVPFSDYLVFEDKVGESPPKSDFIKKIDFIGELLTINDYDYIYKKYLSHIPDFIIKEKLKKFNGTSLSFGRYGNWENYDLVSNILNYNVLKNEIKEDNLDEKLYIKNSGILNAIKEIKQNSNNFESNLILLLEYKYNDLNAIKEFLNKKLVHYVLLKKQGVCGINQRKNYISKLTDNIDNIDIMYIIGRMLFGGKIDNLEYNDFLNQRGFFYDKEKKFTYSNFLNSSYQKYPVEKLIYNFISKIYFNYKGNNLKRNIILFNNILFFIENINNNKNIYKRILENFVN